MHFQNKKKIACAVISVLIALVVYIRFYMAAFPSIALVCSTCVGLITFIIMYSITQGRFGALSVRGNLERIGLVNKKGEPPFLLRQYAVEAYEKGTIYEFTNSGIPQEEWIPRKARSSLQCIHIQNHTGKKSSSSSGICRSSG